jgi:hypothetical protein
MAAPITKGQQQTVLTEQLCSKTRAENYTLLSYGVCLGKAGVDNNPVAN